VRVLQFNRSTYDVLTCFKAGAPFFTSILELTIFAGL
jgi:hypothetical protein